MTEENTWAKKCAQRWHDSWAIDEDGDMHLTVHRAIEGAIREALAKAAKAIEYCDNDDYDPTGKATQIAVEAIRSLNSVIGA